MQIDCDIPKGASLVSVNGEWFPADARSAWLIANNGGEAEIPMNLRVDKRQRVGRITNIGEINVN